MSNSDQLSALISVIDTLCSQGSWCGETHIQKTTYILQELAGIPAFFKFVLYKHGPYSFDLHDELGSAAANGLVKIEVRPAPYGPSWVLTEDGQRLRSQLSKDSLPSAVSLVTERLGKKGVAELERLSTAVWVGHELGHNTLVDRARAIVGLKPHVSYESALAAVESIEGLQRELQHR